MAKKQNPEILCCAPRRGGTHSEWVPPSDGIQSIMAKKQDPEILGCAPLRGGTHSILAYSMPVLSRKIVEYVSSLFFLFFSSPSGVFLSWRAEPILSWQKGGTGKIPNSQWFLSPLGATYISDVVFCYSKYLRRKQRGARLRRIQNFDMEDCFFLLSRQWPFFCNKKSTSMLLKAVREGLH